MRVIELPTNQDAVFDDDLNRVGEVWVVAPELLAHPVR